MMRNNNSQNSTTVITVQPAHEIIRNDQTIARSQNSIQDNSFLTANNLQNSRTTETITINSNWDEMYEIFNRLPRRFRNNLRLDDNLPMIVDEEINFNPRIEIIYNNFFIGPNNQYVVNNMLRNYRLTSGQLNNHKNQLLLEHNQNINQNIQTNPQIIESTIEITNLNNAWFSNPIFNFIALLVEKFNTMGYNLIIYCSRVVGIEQNVLYVFSIIKEWSPALQYFTCACFLAGGTIIIVGSTIYIIRKGHKLYLLAINSFSNQTGNTFNNLCQLITQNTETLFSSSTSHISQIQNIDPIIRDNPIILSSTSPFMRNVCIIADINKKRSQLNARPKLMQNRSRSISTTTHIVPLKINYISTRMEYYFKFLKQNKLLYLLISLQILGLGYISLYENLLFNFHTTTQPFKVFDWEITITFTRVLFFYFILNLNCFILPLIIFHKNYQNLSLWISRILCSLIQVLGSSCTFLTNTVTIIFKYGTEFLTPQDKIQFLKNFYDKTNTEISLLIYRNKYFYLDLKITKEEKLQTLLSTINEQFENLKIINPKIQLTNFSNFLEKSTENWKKNPKEFEKFFETTKGIKTIVNEKILNKFFAEEYIQLVATVESAKNLNGFWTFYNKCYNYIIQHPYQAIGIISGIILISYFINSTTTATLIKQVGNTGTNTTKAIEELHANQNILKELLLTDEKIESITKIIGLLLPTVETNEKLLKQLILQTIGNTTNLAIASQTGCQILTNVQLTKIILHLTKMENGQNNLLEIIRYTLLADDDFIPYDPETHAYTKTIFQKEVEKFQTEFVNNFKTKYPLIFEALINAFTNIVKISKE